MKGTFVSLILVVVLVTSTAAKNYHGYNLDGTRQIYTACDSMIVVKLNESADKSMPELLALEHDALRDSATAMPKPQEFYAFVVLPEYDIDSVLLEIRADPNVEFAFATLQWDSSIVYAYDQLLVKTKPDVNADSAQSLFNSFGLVITEFPSELSSGYTLKLTSSSPPDVFEVASALYETGACVFSTPNLYEVAKLSFFPNDQYFAESLQWHLFHGVYFYGVTYRDLDMHLAWDFAAGDTSHVIAFIDEAFDLDHNDLNQAKIYQPYDAAGTLLRDPLVPDFDPRLPTNGNEAWYNYWHGTACLGIMSAVTNNYLGVAGIASRFRFMPIKDTDDNFGYNLKSIEAAWRWAINHDASVIGLSMQYFDWMPDVNLAIRDAYASGIGVFVSAGNNGVSIEYPAWLPEVMAIGASNPHDSIASFSGRGPGLDVLAPGVDITTLDVSGPIGYGSLYFNCEIAEDYFCHFGGTSAAAPQAAAVAALVLSRRPDLICDTCSAEALYEVIRHSSEDTINISDPLGYDYEFGWGRLNAARAMLAVVRGDANNTGSINIADIPYIVSYIFSGGPAPVPNVLCGDADGTGTVTISDAYYLVSYIFYGGPPPPVSFNY